MQLKLNRLIPWFVVTACTGLMAWVVAAQQPAPVVTSGTLVNAAGNGAEWLTYGHDYAETHFSPLTQVNTKNVKRLSLAWSIATDAPQGTVEATPLMHNGILYFILPWNVMAAVDARTGQTKWRWDPQVPTFANVVKITTFVTDLSEIQVLREIRSEYFGPNPPASTLVQVVQLARQELMIEVEAIAVVAGD